MRSIICVPRLGVALPCSLFRMPSPATSFWLASMLAATDTDVSFPDWCCRSISSGTSTFRRRVLHSCHLLATSSFISRNVRPLTAQQNLSMSSLSTLSLHDSLKGSS